MGQLRPGDDAPPFSLTDDSGQSVIRSTFIVGADGRIERAWYGVRSDGHAGEVVKALGEGAAA